MNPKRTTHFCNSCIFLCHLFFLPHARNLSYAQIYGAHKGGPPWNVFTVGRLWDYRRHLDLSTRHVGIKNQRPYRSGGKAFRAEQHISERNKTVAKSHFHSKCVFVFLRIQEYLGGQSANTQGVSDSPWRKKVGVSVSKGPSHPYIFTPLSDVSKYLLESRWKGYVKSPGRGSPWERELKGR